jgi:hypothetical protein
MPHRRPLAAPILGFAHSAAARFAILAPLSAEAGLWGMGSPSLGLFSVFYGRGIVT